MSNLGDFLKSGISNVASAFGVAANRDSTDSDLGDIPIALPDPNEVTPTKPTNVPKLDLKDLHARTPQQRHQLALAHGSSQAGGASMAASSGGLKASDAEGRHLLQELETKFDPTKATPSKSAEARLASMTQAEKSKLMNALKEALATPGPAPPEATPLVRTQAPTSVQQGNSSGTAPVGMRISDKYVSAPISPALLTDLDTRAKISLPSPVAFPPKVVDGEEASARAEIARLNLLLKTRDEKLLALESKIGQTEKLKSSVYDIAADSIDQHIRIEELSKTIASQAREIEMSRVSALEMKQVISNLQKDVAAHTADNRRLQNLQEKSMTALSERGRELESERRKSQKLKEQVLVLSLSLTETQKQLEELSAASSADFQISNSKSQPTVENLKMEKETLLIEIAQLKATRKYIEKDRLTEEEQALMQLGEANSLLKSHMATLEGAHLSNKQSLKIRCAQLETQNEKFKSQISVLNDELATLRQSVTAAKSDGEVFVTTVADLRSQLDLSQLESASIKRELDEASLRLVSAESRLQAARAEIAEITSKARAETEKSQADIAKISGQYEKARADLRISQLVVENANAEAGAEIARLKTEMKVLTEKSQSLTSQNSGEEFENLKNENFELRRRLQSPPTDETNIEIETLRNELAIAAESARIALAERDEKYIQLTNATKNISDDLTAKLVSSTLEIQSLSEKLNEMGREKREVETDLQRAVGDEEKLRQKYNQLEVNFNSEVSRLQKMVSDAVGEKSQFFTKNLELIEKLGETERASLEIKTALSSKLALAERSLEILSAQISDEKGEAGERILELEKKCEILKIENEKYFIEISMLQKSLVETRGENKSATERAAVVENELKNQISELDAALAEKNILISEIEAEVLTLQSACDEIKTDRQKALTDLAEATKKFETSAEECADLRRKVEEMGEVISAAENQRKIFEEKIESLETYIREKEKECVWAVEELQALREASLKDEETHTARGEERVRRAVERQFELEREIGDWLKKLEITVGERDGAVAELAGVSAENLKNISLISELSSQISSMKIENERLCVEMEKTQEEREALRSALTEKMDLFSNFKKSYDELSERNKKNEEILEGKTDEITSLAIEAAKFESEKEDLLILKGKLEEEISEMERERAGLQEALNSLQTKSGEEITELEIEIRNCKVVSEAKDEEMSSLRARLSELENVISAMAEITEKAPETEEIDGDESSKSKYMLSESFSLLEKKLSSATHSQRDVAAVLKNMQKSMHQRMEVQRRQHQQLNDARLLYESEITTLRQLLGDAETAVKISSEKLADAEKIISNLISERDFWETQSSEKEREIQILTENSLAAERQREILESKLESLEGAVEIERKSYVSLQEEILTKNEEILILKNSEVELRRDLANLNEKHEAFLNTTTASNDVLTEKLREETSRANRCVNELRQAEECMLLVRERLAEQQKQRKLQDNLERELHVDRLEISNLQSQLTKSEREREEMEREKGEMEGEMESQRRAMGLYELQLQDLMRDFHTRISSVETPAFFPSHTTVKSTDVYSMEARVTAAEAAEKEMEIYANNAQKRVEKLQMQISNFETLVGDLRESLRTSDAALLSLRRSLSLLSSRPCACGRSGESRFPPTKISNFFPENYSLSSAQRDLSEGEGFSIEREILTMGDQVTQLTLYVSQQQLKIDNSEKTIRALRAKTEEDEIRISELMGEVNDLRAVLSSKQKYIEVCGEQIQMLSKQKDEIEKLSKSWNEKPFRDAENRARHAEEKLSAAETEVLQLRQIVSELAEEICVMQREVISIERDVSVSDVSLARNRTSTGYLMAIARERETTIKQLQNEIHNLSRLLDVTRGTEVSLVSHPATANPNQNVYYERLVEATKEWGSERDSLKKTIASLQKQNDFLVRMSADPKSVHQSWTQSRSPARS